MRPVGFSLYPLSAEKREMAEGGCAQMRIGIVGCGGRMGRMVLQTVLVTEGVRLSGGVEWPEHTAIGADLEAAIEATPAA